MIAVCVGRQQRRRRREFICVDRWTVIFPRKLLDCFRSLHRAVHDIIPNFVNIKNVSHNKLYWYTHDRDYLSLFLSLSLFSFLHIRPAPTRECAVRSEIELNEFFHSTIFTEVHILSHIV